MCDTTRAIEACPKTQRQIIDIGRIARRIVDAVREHFDDDEEDPRGLARRHV